VSQILIYASPSYVRAKKLKGTFSKTRDLRAPSSRGLRGVVVLAVRGIRATHMLGRHGSSWATWLGGDDVGRWPDAPGLWMFDGTLVGEDGGVKKSEPEEPVHRIEAGPLQSAAAFRCLGLHWKDGLQHREMDELLSNAKKSYRDLAKKLHPDLLPKGMPAQEVEKNVVLFKEVGEAWSFISTHFHSGGNDDDLIGEAESLLQGPKSSAGSVPNRHLDMAGSRLFERESAILQGSLRRLQPEELSHFSEAGTPWQSAQSKFHGRST